MSTYNKGFHGEIRKLIPDTLSYLEHPLRPLSPCKSAVCSQSVHFAFENLQIGNNPITYVTSVDSDQTAHPHSLRRLSIKEEYLEIIIG